MRIGINRVDPQPSVPQLVHIHGSLHNYRRRNSHKQISGVGVDPALQASIYSLLQAAPFLLIVGYQGEENGLMLPLREALNSFSGKPFYWAFHGKEPSKNALKLQNENRVILLHEQDADRLFDAIAKGLKLGWPERMARPVDSLVNDLRNISIPKNIDGIETLFAGHQRKLEQLQVCWKKNHDQWSRTSSSESFASALLAGDLAGARATIDEDTQSIEKWALLASVAADAIIEREQKSASIFLKESWDRVKRAPNGFLDPMRVLRIALAFLEINDLEEAEHTLEIIHPFIKEGPEKLLWARLQDNRGVSLQEQAKLRDDNLALEKAIEAHRLALKEVSRQWVPQDWARMQNNLGGALAIAGQREAEPSRLEEAVSVLRAALEERPREVVPLDWAATQSNLGTALRALGERESGTERLEEAVNVFRAALEERRLERTPLDWAQTQNSLGAALGRLGRKQKSVARLEESLTAFRAALEVYTRERSPQTWAGTQNNLGATLAELGELEGGTARLEEAANAYRATLEESVRERLPLLWAFAQHGLSNCLATLAARSSNPGPILADAITHMQSAVDGYHQVGDKYWGPIAEKRLAELKAKAQ